ncbi:LPS-assembly protein LptD [Henriciella aquimarina]|uniref:LPS-assembly protein LptD n=1 Tax=Henriciella aquimarina TaxID=545261 RepID=UPI001301F11B|nr:LPS assembly protein LptD [Henriciella aquimarina]
MAVWKSAFAALVLGALCQPALAQDSGTGTSDKQASQVTLTADNVNVLQDDNLVIAEGNVKAEHEGRVMTADKLTYNRATGKVRAEGNVVIVDPDGTQRFADEMETNADLATGYASDFSMRMADGSTASANLVQRESETRSRLDRVVYTSCQICEGETTPTWSIRARKAVFDDDEGMYTYRDAVFEVAGIPVLYLPWFAHPDPDAERRSGFMVPMVGSSSKTGVIYQQPYYWAISPYQDLTISPRVNSKVNPLLELDYRKRFYSGQVNFNMSFTNERDFDSDGEKFGDKEWRGHLFGQGRFAINKQWQWGFGVEKATDDLYTKRYDIDGENEQRGLYTNQPRFLLSQVYTQGQANNWYADASVLTFDSLRFDDTREDNIADVLPIGFAERSFDLGGYGFARANASTAFLDRATGTDSQRASFGADWSVQKVLPGGFLAEPFAETRYDHYELDDYPSTGQGNSVDRAFATGGVKLSYPLYRPGKSVDLLVEPIVMGAIGTNSPNQDDIPVEDGLFYELDVSSLFEANAQVGYDLYEGDNKVAAGISTVARWKSGVQISALAGRRWRSRSDPNFDKASNLNGTSSDWIGAFGVDFGGPLKLKTKVRLDEDSMELSRIDTSIDLNFNRVRASAQYYQIDAAVSQSNARQEGILLNSEVKVTDNYFLIYGLRRDMEGKRDIRHEIGVGYTDDCSRFELIFQRSEQVDRTLGPSDSILFRFTLASLGNLGTDTFD